MTKYKKPFRSVSIFDKYQSSQTISVFTANFFYLNQSFQIIIIILTFIKKTDIKTEVKHRTENRG